MAAQLMGRVQNLNTALIGEELQSRFRPQSHFPFSALPQQNVCVRDVCK